MKGRLALGTSLALLVTLGAATLPSCRSEAKPAARSAPALAGSPDPAEVARLELPGTELAPGENPTSVDLVDVPWRSATTGWLVVADYDTPLVDSSFVWGPLLIAGESFSRGFGTYPFSEIVYDLEPGARRFSTHLGVTDDSKLSAGSVRFALYGDEFLLYESGVVRAGEAARSVDVSIEGLSELRLVVDDAGDGSLGDYALWADPRLLVAAGEPSAAAVAAAELARDRLREKDSEQRDGQRGQLRAWIAAHNEARARLGSGVETRAGFDTDSSLLVVANDRVAATLGYGGPRNGRLTIGSLDEDLPRLTGASVSVVLEDGRELDLAGAEPESPTGFDVQRVRRPVLGDGMDVVARFRVSGGVIVVSLTLFDGQSALDLRVSSEGLRLRAVRYLDPREETLLLGSDLRYLSDRSHLYSGVVRADGYVRRAPFEATKPALVWDGATQRGLLFTFFDFAPSPAWLSLHRGPSREASSVGLELEAQMEDFGPEANAAPSLSIELTEGPIGANTFERFRRVVAARYPASDWPSSARYQWGSWYAYGPGVSEASLLREIDQLASRFGDLGPWQLLLDAGWQVQYGREDAELGTVDFGRFPNGVRGVADAAHDRGLSVILYLGLGFVHDSTENGGEWLALRGLIDSHPDWLVPFQPEDSTVRRYQLDYARPDVRAYVGEVLRQFFETHGVDGVLLDGLADAEGQLVPREERDSRSGPPHPLLPSLDLYRFVRQEVDKHRPGAFLIGGWVNPTAANSSAQVFFYADEAETVRSPYPFGGFLEHLDYALFSHIALGQRAYVGASSGDPNRPEARWWIQAGAALGAPATIGTRLERMDRPAIAAFRADLNALEPYRGQTTYGPGLFPDSFATTRDGVTYLGVVNRGSTPKSVAVSLATHGLDAESRYIALDVSTGSARQVQGEMAVDLAPGSFRLFALRGNPGVIWTGSVVNAELSADALHIEARGPALVSGQAQIYSPPPTAVLIDGRPLRAAAIAQPGTSYSYDAASGLLSLAYAQGSPRLIEVRWPRT